MDHMGRDFYSCKRIKTPFFFLFLYFRSSLPAFQHLQTLTSLSEHRRCRCLSTAAHLPSLVHRAYTFFLGECCRFMGKGKKLGASSKKKIIEVDEDQVLKVIENKEFLTMRAATSAWPILTTTEGQLKELTD
jgi:hypothetical protein